MATPKVTKALAKLLAQRKSGDVKGVVYAAIDSERLPLSSFAARAAARDRAIKDRISQIMARIQEWEQAQGRQVSLELRPDAAAVALTAPPALFEALAADEAVAALDVDSARGAA